MVPFTVFFIWLAFQLRWQHVYDEMSVENLLNKKLKNDDIKINKFIFFGRYCCYCILRFMTDTYRGDTTII